MQQEDPGKDLDVKTPKILSMFKNRLFVIIAGSILLVAVILGVYGIFILRDQTASEDPPTEPEFVSSETVDENAEVEGTAEVLPQQQRSYDQDAEGERWSAFEPAVDPFSDPMRLTGVVFGGRGGAMAIIESSGTSYIVAEGDYVDDLWAIRSIHRDTVILRAHNQEVKLFFDQPPVARSLDLDREPEEDDPEDGA